MEFAQRGLHQQNANPASSGSSPAPSSGHGRKDDGPMWSRLSAIVLLISVGILLMAVILFVVTGKTATENKYVDSNKYQAVFLNGGQSIWR